MAETLQKDHNHQHGNSFFNHHHSFKYKRYTNLTLLPIHKDTNKLLYVTREFYHHQLQKHSLVVVGELPW